MSENALLSSLLSDITVEKVIENKLAAANANQEKDDLDEFDQEAEAIMNKMKKERLQEVDNSLEKSKKKDGFWSGEYREIVEEEFLPIVTKNQRALVHFFHNDFERCKIMDQHLRKIASEHPEAAIVSLNVAKAPFFVGKLGIKTLPTLCVFDDGVLKEKLLGFSMVGGKDEFKTIELARAYRK